MNSGAAFRGQPLLLFVGLVAAWTGVRAMTWDAPQAALLPNEFDQLANAESGAAAGDAGFARNTYDIVALARGNEQFARLVRDSRSGERNVGQQLAAHVPPAFFADTPVATMRPAAALVPETPGPMRIVAGHNLLLMAGLGNLPLPETMLSYLEYRELRKLPEPFDLQPRLAANAFIPPPLAGDAERREGTSRFSIDGWLLLRDDSSAAPAAIGGSYGRSQAGLVARYELFPGSRFQPRAYLRATTSLTGLRESELAAGISARPIPGLPVSVAGEVRYFNTPSGDEFRPAAYAVTQFQPQPLPFDFRGEAYFQGGYVGGTYATPFVDGQLRVDRKLVQLGDFELRGGGGAWGGAQEGAQRLDVGPGMSLQFGNGRLNSRLSVDYRFRVVGDAVPASGPALTLSAGF